MFLSPVLESTISPRSPASLYWRVIFKNQNLDTGCAYCYWGFTTTKPIYVYMLIQVCTYLKLFLVLSICIYIKQEFILISPTLIQNHKVHSSFPLLLIYFYFLFDSKKSGFHYQQFIYLLI